MRSLPPLEKGGSKTLDGESLKLDFLLATLFGLEANFPAAREALETINRKSPSKPQVLIRLIQVCEQMRDYSAAADCLKHASGLPVKISFFPFWHFDAVGP